MPSRGLFIAFEGIDRSGKSTQAQRAARALGVSVDRFPNRSSPSTGAAIDAYLRGASDLSASDAQSLFVANRRDARIADRLLAGEDVVVDRWSYSGVAYANGADGVDADAVKRGESGLPRPDVVVFLDVAVAVASQRGGFGSEIYERPDAQERVAAAYRALASDPWSVPDAWVRIDGSRLPDDVHSAVMCAIRERRGRADAELSYFP